MTAGTGGFAFPFPAPTLDLVADSFAPSAYRFSGGAALLCIPAAALFRLDSRDFRPALRIAVKEGANVPDAPKVTISCDEKLGIQTIAMSASDLPPVPGRYASLALDHEYERRRNGA
jgi:hypothetical protein